MCILSQNYTMAGKKSAALNLTARQQMIFENHQGKRSTGHHEHKRISIILQGARGESTYSISKNLGMSIDSVREWRKRWTAGYETLQAYEKGRDGNGVSNICLLKKMLELLKDRPRSGAPCRIKESEKQQLLAMACRKPSEYDIPRTSWTHELLSQVAQQQGIIDQISPRYVGEILKK